VSRYTLEHNFRQLETFAADLEGDARTVRGIARRSPDTCEFVLGESVRLTHNYVAAAMTLVAHTRNVERELFDSVGGLSGCQDRIDRELSSDPLVQFLKRLRVCAVRRCRCSRHVNATETRYSSSRIGSRDGCRRNSAPNLMTIRRSCGRFTLLRSEILSREVM